MLLSTDDLSSKEIYKIVSNTIIPRPIAWISTSNNEVSNIAPFSFFNALSSNPPTLIVSIGHKDNGTPKDTLKNLRETKKCVVSLIEDENFEKMHFSSTSLDENISEFDEFKIDSITLLKEFPKVPAQVNIAYFCTLFKEIDLSAKTVPLILKIEDIYVNDKNIDQNLNILDFDPIARVGKNYAKLSQKLEIPN
jgi:flavin reductase (DIM6/NTAB) family NADH-FMN oxidoreductase RutF